VGTSEALRGAQSPHREHAYVVDDRRTSAPPGREGSRSGVREFPLAHQQEARSARAAVAVASRAAFLIRRPGHEIVADRPLSHQG